MTKKEMLKQLSELPHPITVGLVVFDDGCQFYILTNNEGFACTVGGAFPINGPFKLSPALRRDLMHVMSIQDSDSLEEVIEEHISDESRRDTIFEVLRIIGDDAAGQLFQLNWPAARSFYVFHDMGRGESAVFTSLKAAYGYFLDYFARHGDGLPWESMSDDDLAEWIELVESWRAQGARKLPPREWLGGYHSPWDGTTGRVGFPEE
jgi:hypothetical protein